MLIYIRNSIENLFPNNRQKYLYNHVNTHDRQGNYRHRKNLRDEDI